MHQFIGYFVPITGTIAIIYCVLYMIFICPMLIGYIKQIVKDPTADKIQFDPDKLTNLTIGSQIMFILFCIISVFCQLIYFIWIVSLLLISSCMYISIAILVIHIMSYATIKYYGELSRVADVLRYATSIISIILISYLINITVG